MPLSAWNQIQFVKWHPFVQHAILRSNQWVTGNHISLLCRNGPCAFVLLEFASFTNPQISRFLWRYIFGFDGSNASKNVAAEPSPMPIELNEHGDIFNRFINGLIDPLDINALRPQKVNGSQNALKLVNLIATRHSKRWDSQRCADALVDCFGIRGRFEHLHFGVWVRSKEQQHAAVGRPIGFELDDVFSAIFGFF